MNFTPLYLDGYGLSQSSLDSTSTSKDQRTPNVKSESKLSKVTGTPVLHVRRGLPESSGFRRHTPGVKDPRWGTVTDGVPTTLSGQGPLVDLGGYSGRRQIRDFRGRPHHHGGDTSGWVLGRKVDTSHGVEGASHRQVPSEGSKGE